MSRMNARIATARGVADFLDGIGEPKRAEDVRALCRSATCLQATAASVHRELEDTRRAAGLPTWDRSK
jgi:hypothetical protein